MGVHGWYAQQRTRAQALDVELAVLLANGARPAEDGCAAVVEPVALKVVPFCTQCQMYKAGVSSKLLERMRTHSTGMIVPVPVIQVQC